MEGNVYGYIRVSTREQNIERQLISLQDAGANEKNIYIDNTTLQLSNICTLLLKPLFCGINNPY